jgi:DNA repair exonuclease SbcCD ATPase subunit
MITFRPVDTTLLQTLENMKNELMKATDLQMPSISGTVSVPLDELDRMRAEHATAVKLAQELESHQMEVKIVYSERKQVVSDYDHYGRARYTTSKEVIGTEYKNLNDFRKQIHQEEFDKLQKKFKEQEQEITNHRNALLNLEKEKTEARRMVSEQKQQIESLIKKEAELGDVSARLDDAINDIAQRDQIIKVLEIVVDDLSNKVTRLERPKGFWGFLYKNG